MSVRHDYYQTDDKVVITVTLKKAEEKNYKCTIDENSVLLTADNYELRLELAHPVDPAKSTHKASAYKVEIFLFKATFGRWDALERKLEDKPAEPVAAVVKKKKPEDWEKLTKEIADDKAEGEQAVNELFKKIYEGASEEQRKAMNKSFSESGGTVLSTNWDEVKKDKVDVKPPDGCEFKQWD